MIYTGKAISSGTAYGKIGFLGKSSIEPEDNFDKQNQLELLQKAIKKVSDNIDEEILESKSSFNNRISEIFETHKYIVNDPVLISNTIEYIKQNLPAKVAYGKAVKDILNQFEKIDNEYMLGRIVDIIDATDHVKVALKSIIQESIVDFDEPTILILKNLKPSIIYGINNTNIVGFISSEGFYHQHSSVIARTINIPGIVCENIFDFIEDGDFVKINCENETIEIEKINRRRPNEL
jgi:phosphoenolpyruvate-protein kinase (PTS system EI component)